MAIRVNARARKRFGPLVLNFGARSGISWSLKLWRFTYGHRRRMLSVNTPGIGSVQFTRRREHASAPPVLLEEDAARQRPCKACKSEPGDVCRTKDGRATRMHRARREMPVEAPPPPSALARLLSRVLLIGLVLLLAWIYALVHPAGAFPW